VNSPSAASTKYDPGSKLTMPPKEKRVCPLCHKVGHTTNRSRQCDFFDPNKAKTSSTKKNEAISTNKEQSNEGGEAAVAAAPETIGAVTKTPEEAEPKIKWKKSRAKQLLYNAIKEGRVPLEAKDSNNKSTMPLKDIYNLHPTEFSKYHYSKFSSRISSLRKTIKECNGRAVLDQEAFDNFIARHPVSQFSHKGYIQWQGSDAQEKFNELMEKGKLPIGFDKEQVYSTYGVFFTNFTLPVFREKVYQELRTAKYLHTLEIRGKDARKPKKKKGNEQGEDENEANEANTDS
jgi:hypothetical protein